MANSSHTTKQLLILAAFKRLPRMPREMKREWYRRIASATGCSAPYVQYLAGINECERLGQEIRAKEAAEAKLRVEVLPFDAADLGPIRNFRNWLETFAKFKILSEAFLNLARQQGNVWAASYLSELSAVCERAQNRAAMERHPAPLTEPD